MIKRRSLLSMAAALALLAGWGGRASADVTIFSNFGPSPGFDTDDGDRVGDNLAYAPSMAFAVSPGPNDTFTELDVAANWNSDFGGTNSFVVSLQADNFGTPGATLDSWTTGLPSSPGLLSLMANTPTTLVAGQTYWVTMSPSSGNTSELGNWFENNSGYNGAYDDASIYGPDPGYGIQDAFQVLGNPVSAVPEPSTALPAGLGTLVLIGLAVRARRAGSAA